MNFNYRTIIRAISILLIVSGGAMLFPLLCALYYGENSTVFALAVSMAVSIVPGVLGQTLLPSHRSLVAAGKAPSLKTRDCYLLVVAAWLLLSFLGALPYFLSGQVTSIIDALFESVAGYTTTGASVLLEGRLSDPLILWKAITHWLGGMGILVFMIILLPALGVGGQKIATMEAPGPDLTKLAPRVQDIAKLLYLSYVALSALEFLLLLFHPKMHVFDALINTLGSISTSGLFLHPDGIGYYNSPYIETVLSVFTMLSAMNYVIFISLIKRDIDNIRGNLEVKVYLLLIVLATAIVTLALYLASTYDTVAGCLRHAFFQVVAFASTTGYILDDYAGWPTICLMLFLVFLIIGGCGSSTSGGLKVVRFVVMVQLVARSFRKKIHPSTVTPVKTGDQVITLQATASISTFITLYLITFFVSGLIISFDGVNLESSLTAALSLMSTTGIYLGDMGASGVYSLFSAPIKLFMSLLMIIGRLELYPVFFLLFPSFWNPDKARIR